MSVRPTLQTQLKYETQMINIFQYIFTGGITEVPKSNISGISTEKSPNKTSDITAKNREKLKSHSIVNKDTRAILKYLQIGVNYTFVTPISFHETPVWWAFKRQSGALSSLYTDRNMPPHVYYDLLRRVKFIGISSCNVFVKHVNKMLCNHLLKRDSVCIPYRQPNRLRCNTSRDKYFYRSGVLETVLFGFIFGGNVSRIEECYQLSRFLRTFKEKEGINSNINRYSKSTGYSKLSDECKSLFRSEPIITLENKIITGYFIDFDFNMMADLFLELIPSSLQQSKKNTFRVIKSEFLSMSPMSQTLLMDRLSAIDGDVLYIKLYEKNEAGKHGRRYSTIDSIPRFDRDKIELYGYDMESALQRILYSKLKDKIDLTWTKHYIDNKKAVRVQLAKEFDIPIDEVKMEITAVYQGRYINIEKFPIHSALLELFDEVTEIREYLFDNFWKKSKDSDYQVFKYARKRVKEKYPNKTAYRKLQVSFMFFVWTYYERIIQDVMCEYIQDPLPLHDAVYTQCKELPDMKFIEDVIIDRTDIDMKLGIA